MVWYPKAVKKEIRPGTNDPRIKVVGAILHVTDSDAASQFDYFNGPSNGIESHFHIGKDGTVEQYRDTGFEADANLNANSFTQGGQTKGYVSIETQGRERGEWTRRQIEAIKALLVWLSDTHQFPLRVCRDPKDPGVGYHTLFGAPSAWTPVRKSCPGPDRKKQFESVLVPWMTRAGGPAGPAEPRPEAIEELHPKVKPGARHRQVRLLQECLIEAGYGPIPGAVTDFYGPQTEQAVVRFHRRNPQFTDPATDGDPVIGSKGFIALQQEAGRG